MTQFESLIVVAAIGFIASSIVAHLPDRYSFFLVDKAKNCFGLSIWMLLTNLWPIFSREELINRAGNSMYPFFGYLTLSGFLFFVIAAFFLERKGKGE